MSKPFVAALVFAAASAAPAAAQQFTGGTVSGNIVQLDDTDATKLNAAGELNIAGSFGIGGAVGIYDGSRLVDTDTNLTTRAIYRLSAGSALGAFAARDTIDDQDADTFGVEYGFKSPRGTFDAYYGVVDFESELDETIAGISFEFAVTPGFFLGPDCDTYTATLGSDETAIGAGSLTGRYQLENGVSFFAEAGSVALATSDGTITSVGTKSEFFGIGMSYEFRQNGVSLFSNRSFTDSFGF
ncbi:MAG: hypothetical protein AAFQ09_07930 [Pseudomonadota bacterium]